MSKEAFLEIARMHGLNPEDPRMEDLYEYVTSLLKNLESLDELELADVDPALTFIPFEE